jgi:nickel/cobalt exporter
VALVVGYGVGMAATLTGAGLLLVRFRTAFDRRRATRPSGNWSLVAGILPVLTSALILGVGALLSMRAVAQL